MVICPCSMGTVAAIAAGTSRSLIERAADVALKERRRLVLVPRETPLSIIHLENLLRVSRAGAVVLPAAPGFYHRPTTVAELVDFVIARVLDQLGIPQNLVPPWGASKEAEDRAGRALRVGVWRETPVVEGGLPRRED
jgi:4-hydroxy-3-polyprenylbenzoate decarboxylase